MMGMRAASAATNSLAESISVWIAAGSNASAVLGGALLFTPPFLAGFVTGIGEMIVSVQGPQEPPGSDPDDVVSTKTAVWPDGLVSP